MNDEACIAELKATMEMKVLIISHNPITTYQSMGKTFLSLFTAFDKTELCQLYCYPTMPDVPVCNSYFRLTDRDVLKSFFHFGKTDPRIIVPEEIKMVPRSIYESTSDAQFYKRHKKNALTLLLRDAMWAFAGWYGAGLKAWLEKEKPTCIFLAPGESKFIYSIALRVSEKLDIPIYTYICDEYYFVSKPKGVINCLQLRLLKKKMKNVMSNSKGIITICDELAEVYQKEFRTKAYTILTGTSIPITEKPREIRSRTGITYMGNLTCNRTESIAEIGLALDELNREHGSDYRLTIYSPPLDNETQKLFSEIRSISYAGYVTGEEFTRVLLDSEILLHTESFRPQSIERVKHSISTKIADCLGSGIPLLAYGPEQIASMKHLIHNQCAVIVTKRAELKQTLQLLFEGSSLDTVVARALKTADTYHTTNRNSMMLHSILAGNGKEKR